MSDEIHFFLLVASIFLGSLVCFLISILQTMLEDKDCVVSVVMLAYAFTDSQTLVNLNDTCCVRPEVKG